MAFFDQRLSTRIMLGAKGGPMFSTTVATTTSGKRYPNRNWQYPLHRWNLGEAIRSEADFEEVLALFWNVDGMADSFRFRPPLDHTLTKANSRLTFISGNTWQINRVYALGSRERLRPIKKPALDMAAVAVYRTRDSVETVASATVDGDTGIATISGHVEGDTYTCTGEFDVPVHFTTDIAEFDRVNGNGLEYAGWPDIEIEEDRL